jgi:hypothetical protein
MGGITFTGKVLVFGGGLYITGASILLPYPPFDGGLELFEFNLVVSMLFRCCLYSFCGLRRLGAAMSPALLR